MEDMQKRHEQVQRRRRRIEELMARHAGLADAYEVVLSDLARVRPAEPAAPPGSDAEAATPDGHSAPEGARGEVPDPNAIRSLILSSLETGETLMTSELGERIIKLRGLTGSHTAELKTLRARVQRLRHELSSIGALDMVAGQDKNDDGYRLSAAYRAWAAQLAPGEAARSLHSPEQRRAFIAFRDSQVGGR